MNKGDDDSNLIHVPFTTKIVELTRTNQVKCADAKLISDIVAKNLYNSYIYMCTSVTNSFLIWHDQFFSPEL